MRQSTATVCTRGRIGLPRLIAWQRGRAMSIITLAPCGGLWIVTENGSPKSRPVPVRVGAVFDPTAERRVPGRCELDLSGRMISLHLYQVRLRVHRGHRQFVYSPPVASSVPHTSWPGHSPDQSGDGMTVWRRRRACHWSRPLSCLVLSRLPGLPRCRKRPRAWRARRIGLRGLNVRSPPHERTHRRRRIGTCSSPGDIRLRPRDQKVRLECH